MQRILRGAATLIATGLVTVPTLFIPALAAPPDDVFKDSDNNVYIIGATADGLGSRTRVETDQPYTRTIRASYCGQITVNTTSTVTDIGDSWTVNGTVVNQSSLTALSGDDLPSCSSNAFSPVPSVTNWIDGDYTDSTRERVVFSGFEPGKRYEVVYNDVSRTRSVSENDCGYFRVSNTNANPMGTTVGIDGTTYTVASLPQADPPYCRNEIYYTPETWN